MPTAYLSLLNLNHLPELECDCSHVAHHSCHPIPLAISILHINGSEAEEAEQHLPLKSRVHDLWTLYLLMAVEDEHLLPEDVIHGYPALVETKCLVQRPSSHLVDHLEVLC